jgi:hypothetical protein
MPMFFPPTRPDISPAQIAKLNCKPDACVINLPDFLLEIQLQMQVPFPSAGQSCGHVTPLR